MGEKAKAAANIHGEGGKNRLAFEKSPYLLHHASNPVDWHPWGEEAFEKARREDRPVFLSIGYSTCHWCHVMARESFEDPEVAALLNDAFVNVKVDREERPDVDATYMTVCQMLTGSGGWPLTVVLTPDREPFFAGTYFPAESRGGRVGMVELVPRLKEIWRTRREEAVASAARIVMALRGSSAAIGGKAPGEHELDLASTLLAERFDDRHGGFGSAPKFPTPHQILFLLRAWKRFGDPRALAMAEKTLQAMRNGGIWDHLGFGFHRYSTDRRWLLPHFEKMLYDQAQLASAYIEAHQATGKKMYADTARRIFTYVLRDLAAPDGGFFSAEDADSEGEEGRFYLWTPREIREILGEDDGGLFARAFGVKEGGNFTEEASGKTTGTSILHAGLSLDSLAEEYGLPGSEIEARLETAREALLRAREARVRPFKDTKILADWNGLMIGALAKGAQVLDEPALEAAAAKAADFVMARMLLGDGRLLHCWCDGEASAPANVDDYAFLTEGLLELYESSFEVRYLEQALELTRVLQEDFLDEEGGGFFFTDDGRRDLPVRRKETYDGALPSGNSVAMLNLLRLSALTGRREFEDRALALAEAFGGAVREFPMGYTRMLVAVDFGLGPVREVVVAGKAGSEDTRSLLRALRGTFEPNKIVLFRPAGDDPGPIARIAPHIVHQTPPDGRATAFVCREGRCDLPATDPDALLEQLARE